MRTTTDEALDAFIEDYGQTRVVRTTKQVRKYVLEFLNWLAREHQVVYADEVTTEHMNTYFESSASWKGRGRGCHGVVRSAVRAYCGWLIDHHGAQIHIPHRFGWDPEEDAMPRARNRLEQEQSERVFRREIMDQRRGGDTRSTP